MELLNVLFNDGFNHSDLHFLIGEAYLQKNDLVKSEKHLLQSLRFQIFTPQVLYSLGVLYNRKSMWGRAARCLRKYLSEVETAEAHYEMGFALNRLLSHGEAAIHLT